MIKLSRSGGNVVLSGRWTVLESEQKWIWKVQVLGEDDGQWA